MDRAKYIKKSLLHGVLSLRGVTENASRDSEDQSVMPLEKDRKCLSVSSLQLRGQLFIGAPPLNELPEQRFFCFRRFDWNS